MRSLTLIGFFVGLVSAIIYYAPAKFIISHGAAYLPSEIEVNHINGRIQQGTATISLFSQPIGSVSWKASPLAYFTGGEPLLSLRWNHLSSSANVQLFRQSNSSLMEIENLNLNLPDLSLILSQMDFPVSQGLIKSNSIQLGFNRHGEINSITGDELRFFNINPLGLTATTGVLSKEPSGYKVSIVGYAQQGDLTLDITDSRLAYVFKFQGFIEKGVTPKLYLPI